MKKLVLSLILIASIIPALKAQDGGGDDQKFHFGLKATPTICWTKIDAEGVKNDGIKIGFTYGLMTEFRIAKNYAFLTGVDVSYRGGKYKVDLGSLGEYKFDQKFQYIDIPVSLKLKTNEIGYIKYFGTFGFLPGLMVKATEDVDSPFPGEDRDNRSNQSDFGKFDMGILVGGGLEYNIGGSTSVNAGIVFKNGFIDVWDQKNAKMTTNYITLNLGVLF